MITFSLEHKKALITGAGRGIGAEIAKGLARFGADIMIVSRTESELQEVKKAIEQEGIQSDVKIYTCDVSDSASVKALGAYIEKEWQTIDILVNNAGINQKQNFLEVNEETWRKIIDINLTGQFLIASMVAKIMAKNQGGSIINTASVGGLMALPLTGPYCASKGGIIQMTKVMAEDLAQYNIRANAICPGYIDTGLLKDPEVKKKMMEKFASITPLGRAGEVEDLVGAVVFLAGDASKYVTGIALPIDGGMSCSVS